MYGRYKAACFNNKKKFGLYVLISLLCLELLVIAISNLHIESAYSFNSSLKPGTDSEQIAVGKNKDGSLVVFSVDPSNNLYYKLQLAPGSTQWGDWVNLGTDSKQIAVGNDKSGNLMLFSISPSNNLYYKYQLASSNGNGNWSSWVELGSGSKQIAVGNDKSGNLMLFSISPSNNLYYKSQLASSTSGGSGNWSNWIGSIGGDNKQIAVGNDKSGNLVVFSVDLHNNLYYKHQLASSNSSLSNWTKLGGGNNQTAIGNDKSGNLVVFSVDPSNNLYYKSQLASSNGNGNWSSWVKLGSGSKQIAVGNDKSGNLALFSIGLDNNLYYKSQLASSTSGGSGNWSGPTILNEVGKQIAVGNDKSGNLALFSIGLDNNLYYKHQLASSSAGGSGSWSGVFKLGSAGQDQSTTVGIPWLP
jgi:tectonin-like protein